MANNFFPLMKILQLFKVPFGLVVLVMMSLPVSATTPLADRPVYNGNVSGNVALALSVEWPTGVTSSYKSITNYQENDTYLGYFDSEKCYAYQTDDASLALDLYSTGVDDDSALLGNNADDKHWSLVGSPSGTSNYQKNRLNNTTTSYSTSTARHIGWAAGSVPAGQYTYESDAFNIPASVDPNDVKLVFEVMPDDQLIEIQVNGVTKSYTLSNTPSWNNPATVTLPTGTFSTYVNQLKIVINNTGGPTGLRVDQINFGVESGTSYGEYFKPVALANNHSCQSVSNGRWSGNFLNWSLTQVIDPFRHALTGGNRDVDEANKTILVKAHASGDGGKLAADRVLSGASDVRGATPFDSWNYLKLRINGLDTSFYVTGSSSTNIDSPSSSNVIDGADMDSSPSSSKVYAFKGRVEVCVAGLLEDNCHSYPSGYYKPIGLIQENAEKLRFSALGYLNDSDNKRDGGVLRARMAAIGPSGNYPEWEESTGIFLTNPHAADALASGVDNSGVINYLNKFGYNAPGYKSRDPVSELYYTAGRYLRYKGNVAEYSALSSNPSTATTQKDGFPVITNWADPIRFSCESNFIIGIGDTNTHADANLPGSTVRTSNEPSMPSAVSNDYGSVTDTSSHYTDVLTSTNRVGDLEGISNLGGTKPSWCCNGNSYLLSGLAYDLHTRDFRPDLTGKQTVSTYWLDVMEAGFINKNQYWLATKYGGFTVPDGYDPYGTLSPLNQADWDANNDGDPDHYFRANNPANMEESLARAFDSILSEVDKVSTGFALSSPNVASGEKSYGATYKSGVWTGSIAGYNLSFDASGNPIETEAWNTNTTFESQVGGTGWDSQRKIITANCTDTGSSGMQNCSAVPFRHSSLNADNQSALNNIDIYTGVSQEVLNYLRGDKTNEGKYRTRTKILGDIVNSKIAPVGPPNAPYSDAFNPGYSAFKSTYASRTTTVYVGANDGMLHAFNGSTGLETFAYVPEALYKGPDNYPQKNGLAALAYNNYLHHFYVDASPSFFDVNFGTNDWHTVLFSGLGKGGKSYFAFDITNPDAITTEAAATTKLLWEFTHEDLGFTYGRPISVKVDGKWVVIFTSGYNNQDGKGYFFVVDPQTGALINKVTTGVGSTSNEAGLAHLTAFIANGQDFTADAVYAGDLLGNLWRLDLSGISTTGYSKTPTLIATLQSPNGSAQPITTSPVVEYDQSAKERIVFVGTGRLLDETDLPINQVHTIYAIKDGDQSAFYTSGTLPSGVSGFPITRSLLIDHTDEPDAIVQDANKPMGYYIDMASGFYIDRPMVSSAGTIAVLANQIIGDSCDVDSIFRGYVLNYATGRSLITNINTGITTQYIEGNGLANNIAIYQNPNTGKLTVNISHEDDSGGNTSVEIDNTSVLFKALNWRLVPIE